jgi:hypothetical protein
LLVIGLKPWQVKLLLGRVPQGLAFYVPDHPDDLPSYLLAFDLEVVSDWVLAHPASLREGLIDDHDGFSGVGVAVREAAPLNQWNSHGAEIVTLNMEEHRSIRLWFPANIEPEVLSGSR